MNKAENSTSEKTSKHRDNKFSNSIISVEKKIGYSFSNKLLLESALTHPSYLRENDAGLPFEIHYQRLEFLGDSILGCIIAHHLFSIYPTQMEGFLSKAYSVLSRGEFLAKIAKKIKLGNYVKLRGHKDNIPDSILSDTIEAIIGAIFLDAGYDKTFACVINLFGKTKTNIAQMLQSDNPKGQLQEYLLDKAKLLDYRLSNCEISQSNCASFCVDLYLGDELLATGSGNTKKKAEECAAAIAIKRISNSAQNPDAGV